jgi:hypothetical protein
VFDDLGIGRLQARTDVDNTASHTESSSAWASSAKVSRGRRTSCR